MATLGPSGFSPYPVAVYEGVLNPPPGKALMFNEIVDEEIAMREAAKAMLTLPNATIFPGPQVLYAWNEEAKEKAKLVRKMAEVLNAKIIPMYDYRPKYPKIDPAVEEFIMAPYWVKVVALDMVWLFRSSITLANFSGQAT